MLATLWGRIAESQAKATLRIWASTEKVKELAKKEGSEGFKSLLQMIYHPNENQFYKQVAIQAHAASEPFLNIRENLGLSL